MKLIDLLIETKAFYEERFGQPPATIVLGEALYDELRAEVPIEHPRQWRGRPTVLGMAIEVSRVDPYALGIENYRRYAAPTHRFDT